MKKVAVFGSVNMDLIVTVPAFAQPGETIAAEGIAYKVGGKGGNQAAAAAAVGASTILIASVGEDAFGQQIVAELDKVENLDSSRIVNVAGQDTGVAAITVADAQKTIAVVQGANAATDLKRAADSGSIFEQADVVLGQFEVPIDATAEALRIARAAGKITMLNIAPYKPFDRGLLADVNVLIANETEFEAMAGEDGIEDGKLELRMAAWQKKYPHTRLIVTRGADGLTYTEGGAAVSLEAAKIETVVDTIGAGDTFCGVLAALAASDMPYEEAVYKASVAAGLSTQHEGALGSAPKMEDIDLYIARDQEDADTPIA